MIRSQLKKNQAIVSALWAEADFIYIVRILYLNVVKWVAEQQLKIELQKG